MHADQSWHPNLLPSPGIVDGIAFLQHPLINAHVGELSKTPSLQAAENSSQSIEGDKTLGEAEGISAHTS